MFLYFKFVFFEIILTLINENFNKICAIVNHIQVIDKHTPLTKDHSKPKKLQEIFWLTNTVKIKSIKLFIILAVIRQIVLRVCGAHQRLGVILLLLKKCDQVGQ